MDPRPAAHSSSVPPSQQPPDPHLSGTDSQPGPSSLDPRVHFDKTTGKWHFEDDDGREYEWMEAKHAWVPLLEESLWAAQQAAYKVDGVDENTPAISNGTKDKKQLKLEKQNQRKNAQKKRALEGDPNSTGQQRNTAIYITRLPLDATTDELHECFSRAGLILVDEENQPKIKFYKDQTTGLFNGSALVVFLKPESVELAIQLFDDTALRLGASSSQERMQVSRAEFSHKKQPLPPTNSDQQQFQKRQKRAKKVEKLKTKLEEWDSDDEKASAAQTRFSKVVVLKHMFTLAELQEDPALLLDLKEDVREECELLGNVTNVTLYDLEPDGVMTVKFKEPIAAQACIVKMNNRFFAGRQVGAFLYDGNNRYRKSGHGSIENEEGTEAEQKKRLEAFAKFLEDQ
ncbi:hypothetical protein O181_059303 [Austropuccinia psidii MF-1]|uniref:RRM domain-containing protein n=1 Tax=Austropuccinia psidii MF-1 TaxID=1389203 RepID=A0A9Q3EEL2_9BASI|nr:hypothetical protein [Austropuccinia psidii MF-1]